MTTEEAIKKIQDLIEGNNAMIAGYTAQNETLNVAIKQLQGVLDTPSADLEKAQADIADLSIQLATEKEYSTEKEVDLIRVSDALAASEAEVVALTEAVAQKNAEIAAIKPAPVELEPVK